MLNKGIPTPIAIGIILILAILVGSSAWWYYPGTREEEREEPKETPAIIEEETELPQILKECSDQTSYGQCSSEKPKYCDDGNLVDKCSICGCTKETEICGENGECYSPLCSEEPYDSNIYNCVNDKLVLKHHTKRYGALYIYWNDETYNSEWNEEISPLFDKAKNALLALTEDKANYEFDILGSIKTKEFCWNPSRLAWASQAKRWKIDKSTGEIVDYYESDYIDETDEYHRGDPTNLMIIPGSDFGIDTATIDSYEQVIFEDGKEYLVRVKNEFYYNDCDNCKIYEKDRTQEFQELFLEQNYTSYSTTYLEMDCGEGNLVKQKFNSEKRNRLKERAAEEIGFNLEDYDDIFLIFGRLGPLLPYELDINHYRRCHLSRAFVVGYSSLILAENGLYTTGFLDCTEYYPEDPRRKYSGFYMKEGWNVIAHELLHKLGAVDVYSTTFTYGVKTYSDEAKELDSRYQESIMGDRLKPCMTMADYYLNEFPDLSPEERLAGAGPRNTLCSQEILDEVYLDKLNKQKIGLE